MQPFVKPENRKGSLKTSEGDRGGGCKPFIGSLKISHLTALVFPKAYLGQNTNRIHL